MPPPAARQSARADREHGVSQPSVGVKSGVIFDPRLTPSLDPIHNYLFFFYLEKRDGSSGSFGLFCWMLAKWGVPPAELVVAPPHIWLKRFYPLFDPCQP